MKKHRKSKTSTKTPNRNRLPKTEKDLKAELKRRRKEIVELKISQKLLEAHRISLIKEVEKVKAEVQFWQCPERSFGSQDFSSIRMDAIKTWIFRLYTQDRFLECIIMSPQTLSKCGYDVSKPIFIQASAGRNVQILPCESIIDGKAIFVGKHNLKGY